MYAIIKTGGKQYRVQEGDTLKVEKLAAEAGSQVTFGEVLAVSSGDKLTVGSPNVAGATVVGTVVAQGKGEKVVIFKYKPKKSSANKKGHRQPFTEVKIEKINA